jgi:hypothetical protein
MQKGRPLRLGDIRDGVTLPEDPLAEGSRAPNMHDLVHGQERQWIEHHPGHRQHTIRHRALRPAKLSDDRGCSQHRGLFRNDPRGYGDESEAFTPSTPMRYTFPLCCASAAVGAIRIAVSP